MASNYHLGYKTNVVRTVSGQEVALSGTGGDSNNIEIDDLYQGVVFNLPIGKTLGENANIPFTLQELEQINNAKVGQRYYFQTQQGEDSIEYSIFEVSQVENGKIKIGFTYVINLVLIGIGS